MLSMLRLALPQLITGVRAVLGAWAMLLAAQNDLNNAGILLIAGLVSDRLDGLVAKWLHVESEFGYRIDCFADYLYYLVVPPLIAYRLAGSPNGGWLMFTMALPLLAGAVLPVTVTKLRFAVPPSTRKPPPVPVELLPEMVLLTIVVSAPQAKIPPAFPAALLEIVLLVIVNLPSTA